MKQISSQIVVLHFQFVLKIQPSARIDYEQLVKGFFLFFFR